MGVTFIVSTTLTVKLPAREESYWNYVKVHNESAIIPFISDTATGNPSWFAFASGLTVAAGILLIACRAAYEGLDAALLHDEAERVVECAAMRHHPSEAPAPHPGFTFDGTQEHPQPERHPQPFAAMLCCTRGRLRFCCFGCCSQSLRHQNYSAWVCACCAAPSVVVLAWCNETIFWDVHVFFAAVVFAATLVHLLIIQRVQAVRCTSAASHVTPGDRLSAVLRAGLVWFLPCFGIPAVLLTLAATHAHAGTVWSIYLSPLLEWWYVGVLGVHVGALQLEIRHCLGGSVKTEETHC